jgi:hypothetical protein
MTARPKPPREKKMPDLDTPITRADMNSVIVKKDALLETLKANRGTHRAVFEEALIGYKDRAIELLTEHIERIKKGKVEKVFVSLPQPEDHTDDYDRAIATLEWTIFDEVELTINEFDMYVRDNWRWKQEFVGTTSLYNSNAR